MSSIHHQLSEQFRQWEIRGRGWRVYDGPVSPEPPFVPFDGHYLPLAPPIDDGRKPTFISSFIERLSRKLSTEKPDAPVELELGEEPEPHSLVRERMIELHASLPDKLDISQEAFERFLSSISLCREPIAFELIGTHQKVTAQFAAAEYDAPLLRRQLAAYFPEAAFVPREGVLTQAWNATTGEEIMAVEFGLKREFMLPLNSGKLDPFIGIVGALAELQPGELGLFQVLFQPAHEAWSESIINSVTHTDGKPFFVNSPELTGAAEQKITRPLFAAVVRMMICAGESGRLMQLARDLAGSLRVFAHPQGNELIPLKNDDYPFEEHIADVLARQSRRTGMLLNAGELIGFVHIPTSAIRSPTFQRQSVKAKAAPAIVRQSHGLLLGTNEHAGETVEVRLSPEHRVHHAHIIGASGSGKSTLLFNLISQAIQGGEGIAVLDPHGDLIDRVLGVIPDHRINDVVLVDPADEQFSIGFNILSAHSDLEKNLLASDLVAVFQRLSTSWGDQMNSVLQNAILAFLESNRRGTIADLRRFLIEPPFRNDFLKSVRDEEVVYYWQKSFPHLTGGKSIGPILTRLDAFLAQKPIRYMVSQPENKLDFARIMDGGKIFLAKLPEGLLGRENSHLLGTLLVSKFQQIAMSRQAQRIESRRMFNIFIDEFANFITPSMAEILSGARKYRIGLTLAHHELHQLQRSPEVASAVMTHPFTRIVFRVGDDDAKKLGEGFAFFEAKDLRNLETGQAICRVERSDYDFNLAVPLFPSPVATAIAARRLEVITASRKEYSTARADVEAILAKSRTAITPSSPLGSKLTEAPASAVHFPCTPPTGAAEVSPMPSPPQNIPPSPESKSLAVPAISDIPVLATARAGVVEAAMPLPPLLTSKGSETSQATERTSAPTPRNLGRGGAQHQAIQKRIKEAAEKLGFRGVIEKPVPDGSVDLWLERAEQSFACEISISTTIDHEVGNIAKCLKAGIPNVAVICLDDERLRKVKSAVSGALGAEQAARVVYFQPDPFIAHLKASPRPAPMPAKIAGYTVKRSTPKLSTTEQQQKEDAANHIMAEALRSQKKR